MEERINLGSNPAGDDEGGACAACMPEFDMLLSQSPALAAGWERAPRRALKPGQALVTIGQRVRQVWRVESGLFRLYYLSPDGRERNRSFHAEGKWLGAGVPPGETDSPYAIEALEPAMVVEVAYTALEMWGREHPAVSPAIQDVLAKIFLRQSQREAELLLLDATSRYSAFLDYYGQLAQRIPLHHVASYLGITNVALSRIRRGMKTS